MVLLDTHFLVWMVAADDGRLHAALGNDLAHAVAQGEAAVSAATFWELALLRRKRRDGPSKMPPPADLRSELLGSGLIEFPVSGSLWIDAVGLADEGFHDDPADQLIVATAIKHRHDLLTRDGRILSWANRTGRVALYASDVGRPDRER